MESKYATYQQIAITTWLWKKWLLFFAVWWRRMYPELFSSIYL